MLFTLLKNTLVWNKRFIYLKFSNASVGQFIKFKDIIDCRLDKKFGLFKIYKSNGDSHIFSIKKFHIIDVLKLKEIIDKAINKDAKTEENPVSLF